MDWKKAAADDLRRYPTQKASLDNIIERMIAANERMTAVKGATLDRVPVHGGGSAVEDKILDCITERERLKLTYAATKRLVDIVERGLAALTDTERRVLELFYITPARGNVERLMSELGYEKAQIYRLKDTALNKFTTALYGLPEY